MLETEDEEEGQRGRPNALKESPQMILGSIEDKQTDRDF